MKVGIITQPLGRNYGGILQNWALQQILLRMGHHPITIVYQGMPEMSYIYNYCRSLLAYAVKHVIRHPYRDQSLLPWKTPPYSNLRKFISKHILKTKFIPTISSDALLKIGINNLILGSDQIWRPQYNEGYLDIMFCNGIKHESKLNCISYAASFGCDEWEYSEEETSIARKNMTKFNAISVREATAVNLCKNHLGVESIQVLDPTLLLSKDDYDKLVKRQALKNIPYDCIGVFFLDHNEEKNRIVDNVCKIFGKKPYYFGVKIDKDNEYQGVEDWLASFTKCPFIITDSFHGTVFSIIYKTPFISIANQKRGLDRFRSLLSIVDMNDRLYLGGNQIIENIVNRNIDWSSVDSKIYTFKKRSLSYLEHNLTHTD